MTIPDYSSIWTKTQSDGYISVELLVQTIRFNRNESDVWRRFITSDKNLEITITLLSPEIIKNNRNSGQCICFKKSKHGLFG